MNGKNNCETSTSNLPPNGQSQYRATRIWYEIVNSFYANVTLKKHWRNFRAYQDCFAACEAIEWLFGYLKQSPNFKSHTSLKREQAVQLLQVFLKDKIIEDVRASSEKYIFKPFSDDDRLYKFNTNHRFYHSWIASKPDKISSNNKTNEISNQTDTDLSTSNMNDNDDGGFNEKSIDVETKQDEANVPAAPKRKSLDIFSRRKQTEPDIIDSKIIENNNSEKENITKMEENNHKITLSNRSKNENDIWSLVVHDLLESIVNKAIVNLVQAESDHSSKKQRFNDNSNQTFDLKFDLDELLFEGKSDFTKNKLIGSYVNHNCNHINKHGVVTETEDDFPAWLVKAMTSLLKWKQERNEFPKFEDVYEEINNYFNDINEPLLTKDISRLLFQIMKLLLLPQYYVPSFNDEITNSNEMDMECSVMHDNNTRIFETVMKNLSNRLSINQTNEQLFCASNDVMTADELEANLIENAKLPIIPIDSNETDYNPGCCEDCSLRHNFLNNFINTSAIEFNEFVTSINDLGIKDQIELLKLAEENLDEFVEQDEEEEQYDEFDTVGVINSISFKQCEDKLSRLKLNSPFKSKKPPKPLNRSLTKSFADRKLHRNNSFRAAIGEIGTILKTSTLLVPPSEFSSKSATETQSTSTVKELLKKFDDNNETFKFNTLGNQKSKNRASEDFTFKQPNIIDHKLFQSSANNQQQITKSTSMQSIQTSNVTLSNQDEDALVYDKHERKNSMDALKKRKLADAFHSLNRSQINKLNTFNSLNGFGMTPSLPRNYSFQNKLDLPPPLSANSNLPRLSMTSLKSYNDLCDIIFKTENNTASLNNLTDDDLVEVRNKTASYLNKTRMSHLSLNTLNSMIINTFNNGSSFLKENDSIETEKKQKRKTILKRLDLTAQIESDTLCFIINAFRLCALMLPPSNKRKLHLLLRFLYKLKCDQNSAKYLVKEHHNVVDLPHNDELRFIDSSILTSSSTECLNFTKQNDYNSFCLSTNGNQQQRGICNNFSNTSHSSGFVENKFHQKAKLDLKELESKSKEVEKFIIKSFFKSILTVKNNNDMLEEEQQLIGMKIIQILINHYPEVMRIPEELVKNVNTNLAIIKPSRSAMSISSTVNSKISLHQYDKQSAEISKQHLADLLNNILTDMSIKDEDKLQRLKKFKDMHPNIYEEKYSTIKKALNILGLNNSAAFLVPTIDKTSKNYFLDDISNRRDSNYYLKKRSQMAKLTDSAKKRTTVLGSSNQMNQTVMPVMQTFSSSSITKNLNSSIGAGLPKFFLNKLKKDNL